MRPGVWPDQIKDKITNHLENSKHLDVKTWIKLLKNTNDSDYFDLFKSKLHEHDDYRKLDFSIVFPELAEFVAK
jgi:hypothetical protein